MKVWIGASGLPLPPEARSGRQILPPGRRLLAFPGAGNQMSQQVEKIVMGGPADEKTTMGPMANKQQMATEMRWGGNVKESGVGKSGNMCGLEEFTDLKMVCINYAP